MWLFFAFLCVPLIEIALFIQVGGLIGLWPTLAIVIVTAVLGASMVRSQGISTLGKLQSSFETLNDPAEPLAHGAMILFAGALLLTPGFFTDFCGFMLLIPAVRAAVFNYAKKRVTVQTFSYGETNTRYRQNPAGDDIIDGEFTEVDPERRSVNPPSEWTKH